MVQPALSLAELQVLNGEVGKCMGEFNKAMVEFFSGKLQFSLASF